MVSAVFTTNPGLRNIWSAAQPNCNQQNRDNESGTPEGNILHQGRELMEHQKPQESSKMWKLFSPFQCYRQLRWEMLTKVQVGKKVVINKFLHMLP